MAKIVVLGSNAFSGQDFIDLLLEDPTHQVIGVSRSPEYPDWRLRYRGRSDLSRYRFHRMDMNRDMPALLEMLDRETPSHIVNFAAQSEVAPSWEHPEQWFSTNTVALATLINHLRRRDYLKRYLHISSPEAYGNCVGTVAEATPDNPSTPYAASKAAADMLVSVYQKQYGFPAVTVRATNVYGARQQLFKIIPRTAIYLKLGRKVQLHGGGVAVKSYIHVRDISKGERAVLFEGRVGERYHLSPDNGIAVRDVVETICKAMGRNFNDAVEVVAERPGQDSAYVIDSTKARSELGWRPEITMEAGLVEVGRWVEDNWEQIARASLEYDHKP
ncbi:MAG: GDP-mannose 4,6-dehydratase [Alphaproteobacteria bacterium]